jgi:hypothetical protein
MTRIRTFCLNQTASQAFAKVRCCQLALMLGLYPPMPVLYCMVALLDCCAFCGVECGAAAGQPILYSGGLFVNKLVLNMLYLSDGCLPDIKCARILSGSVIPVTW